MNIYAKKRGQALPLIALSTLALLAIVGLAIDGGSLFNERRRAQNAADGAVLAGARTMLGLYQSMIQSNPADVDGTAAQETAIKSSLNQYASLNGVNISDTASLTAYFVNDSKQIVTVAVGSNGCGLIAPCTVGNNGSIPWTRGAKGIVVTGRTETSSFFMAVFAWNKLKATASATAYMGVAQDTNSNLGLFPIGFFTDTQSLANLQVGQTYTLINGTTRQGSGNWGYVDFNGNGNPAPVVNAMLACGFNPAITLLSQWQQWCRDSNYQNESRALGPDMYWTGTSEPLSGPYYSTRLECCIGWWLAGSSGTTNSTCQVFEAMQNEIRDHDYLIPVFDANNGQGGNNTKFHLIDLAWFHITTTDIQCHPQQGQEAHWSIQGQYMQRYSSGSSGGHGNVRHTSNPVVFLEP